MSSPSVAERGPLARLIFSNKQMLDRTRSPKALEVLDVEPLHEGFASLDGHTYMLLVTYKRDGQGVPMPVWFGKDGDRLFVWTEENAYKAKRLRNNPRALVAPCGPRGEPLGPPIAARGRVLESRDERTEAKRVILADWGFFRRIFERSSRRLTGVIYMELVPE
jgi:PPOX class probable F420-dependent enzyme